MGLSSAELEQHCQQILGDRRIRNKIVVLCEGEIKDIAGRRSPQAYKRMEQMPDANFYKSCVPKSWCDKPKPQFFNCGDRKDVIDTYFKLLELDDYSQSYLNKSKLFALVDLDLQLHKIDNYQYSDTEQIFNSLYKKNQVIKELAAKHFIWVTGLIHKEAYFITPDLQTVFNSYLNQPHYNNVPLLLRDLYLKICQEITEDIDLKNNFERVVKRINYNQQLNCCDIEQLQSSWKNQFSQCSDNTINKELVLILLTMIKAKKYWEKIDPPSDWTGENFMFREQLSLEIGKFQAKLDWHNPEHHIPCFFNTLYKFA